MDPAGRAEGETIEGTFIKKEHKILSPDKVRSLLHRHDTRTCEQTNKKIAYIQTRNKPTLNYGEEKQGKKRIKE